jgi:hypothetical protein
MVASMMLSPILGMIRSTFAMVVKVRGKDGLSGERGVREE